MSRFRKFLAMSFRAKLLVPVILVMICLLAVTAWIVDRQITKQFETEAHRALLRADEGFHDWQVNRANNLVLRVGDLRNEPRFRAVLLQTDTLTKREALPDILNAAGEDVKIVSYTTAQHELVGSTKRDPLIPVAEFETASATAVKRALQGEESVVDTIHVGDKLYDVVAVPISNANGEPVGALTFGMEIGFEVAQELSRFTRSQIVLLANDKVSVHTMLASDSNSRFVALFKELSRNSGNADSNLQIKKEILDGGHYYCSDGRFTTLDGNGALGYLLLYSYEDSWLSLQKTQEILLAANGIAVLIGAIIVCFLVGRATQPLRELRASAEAVGRGDFSRRVTVRSEDDLGELAQVFNQMTENLKNSREQLEMTVETLKTTQAQLIQSEKLSGIGEFIAVVAHELNNPLTSVMGFSELLQKVEIEPQHKKHLEMIHKSALRCQKIVQALLGFARRSAPERKAVCVNKLIEASLEILQYQLRTS